MKRVALIVSLLCCVLSASAQNAKGWSLIPYAKVASSIDFLYGPYESKFHGDLGVDVKYDFNEHWSLLGGRIQLQMVLCKRWSLCRTCCQSLA